MWHDAWRGTIIPHPKDKEHQGRWYTPTLWFCWYIFSQMWCNLLAPYFFEPDIKNVYVLWKNLNFAPWIIMLASWPIAIMLKKPRVTNTRDIATVRQRNWAKVSSYLAAGISFLCLYLLFQSSWLETNSLPVKTPDPIILTSNGHNMYQYSAPSDPFAHDMMQSGMKQAL